MIARYLLNRQTQPAMYVEIEKLVQSLKDQVQWVTKPWTAFEFITMKSGRYGPTKTECLGTPPGAIPQYPGYYTK